MIKHYSVNQGLPSSECYSVIQDSKGYLWIATDAGIVKYDGYKFITYNSSKGLPDNTVFKIHEDNHGNIWFASYSGKMSYYSHQSDSIYSILANAELDKLTEFYPIDFAFDTQDTLYISISRFGYVKLAPPLYSFCSKFSFKSNCCFLKKISHNLAIYGLNIRDYKKKGSPLPIMYSELNEVEASEKTQPFSIPCLFPHISAVKNNDSSFLFSNGVSVLYLSRKSKSISYSQKNKYFDNNHIISIYKDNQGRVWLNNLNGGTEVFENSKFEKRQYHFLPNLSVSSVLQDKDNGFWLTTLEDGVFYIPSLHFNFIDHAAGLSAKKVLSICLIGNNLKCLTSDFSINDFDLRNQRISLYEKFQLSAWYIAQSDSCMLVCNSYPYIDYISCNKKINLWTRLGDNSISYFRVKKAVDFSDEYFLGFDLGYVFLANKKTGECTIFLKGLPTIFSIQSQGNKMWIGTKNGLYLYSNKKLEYFGEKIPILKNRVEGTLILGDTVVFITRGYGVLCMVNNKIIQQITEKDGLASNMTKCIIEDRSGNIWIGTNRGISRLWKGQNNQFNVSSLNITSGLVSNEVNQIVEHQNKIYFATNSGLGIFSIEDFYNLNSSIPIYIENFYVNNIKIDSLSNNKFKYTQNFIRILYNGVSVKCEGDIIYKYRLDGLDTSWTFSKNTYVQYTTLPPGTYKFIVYAVNQDGKLSVNPAIISFVIEKPFWKTWWFFTIIVLLFFAFIYFAYRIRIDFIRKQESEKTDMNKRISESELKALRAQMNPHFMFNAINSIQNFVLKNDSKSAQKYLTKFARLIRSVLENSKHDLVWLNKEVEALELYIELEALRASFNFDYEIIIEDSLNAENLYIPPMIIQPYIENAILHGIMPLYDRRGKLEVRFSKSGSVLKCVIDDNGIGRKKAKEIKERKQLAHQSMGMGVTQDRIDILNKQNDNLLTKVVIIDKMENDLPAGTTVEITINIKNSRND